MENESNNDNEIHLNFENDTLLKFLLIFSIQHLPNAEIRVEAHSRIIFVELSKIPTEITKPLLIVIMLSGVSMGTTFSYSQIVNFQLRSAFVFFVTL